LFAIRNINFKCWRYGVFIKTKVIGKTESHQELGTNTTIGGNAGKNSEVVNDRGLELGH